MQHGPRRAAASGPRRRAESPRAGSPVAASAPCRRRSGNSARLAAAALIGLAPLAGTGALAADLQVAASIKPVHSLVAAVMEGAGAPVLVDPGGGSPHGASLKPSQARALARADLVFWVGEEMETFLAGAVARLARDGHVLALADAPGVELLAMRRGGVWAPHDREEHDDHDTGLGGDAVPDLHIWLDPANARAMVAAIVQALGEADPDNRARYVANGRVLEGRLTALEAEIEARLAPVRAVPFIVFHDAYQYLEHRFGLAGAGSITLHPEIAPGAATLTELRRLVAGRGAVCVFSEPQFEPRLVRLVIEGARARAAVLDPVGADLEPGPDLYFTMMRRNAESLAACLGG